MVFLPQRRTPGRSDGSSSDWGTGDSVRRTTFPPSLSTTTLSPGAKRPSRSPRARGSWIRRWIARFRGRAPNAGIVPRLRQTPLGGSRSRLELDPPLGQGAGQARELQVHDRQQVFLGQRAEDDRVVDAVQELGPERLPQRLLDVRRRTSSSSPACSRM